MKKLTQGDLLTYLQSPKHFWARMHGQYISPPKAPRKIDQIRPLAESYIKDVFKPNFQQPQLLSKVAVESLETRATLDFVIKEKESGKTHLIGVKPSYRFNSEYVDELSFKLLAAEDQFSFDRIFLILLNNHYSRMGDMQVKYLFQVIEVTSAVKKRKSFIKNKTQDAIGVAKLPNVADFDSCTYPDNCPAPHLCHPNLPDFSIYDLRGISTIARKELRGQGILKIEDVPLSFLENEKALQQRQLTKDKATHMDPLGIQKELSQLEFPLYFLDYEAYGFPMPLFDGYWPYSTVVFQYSLHKLHQDGTLDHFEFLHQEKTDPAPALISSLREHIGDTGSIVVWGKQLEEENHRQLARLHPEEMLFLLELNQRMYDLQDIFSHGLYLDYRFKGSTSLKKVLPVIDPDSDYQALEISDGLVAANSWFTLIHGQLKADEKQTLAQELKTYCAMDTMALVKIYQYLDQMVNA